MEKVWKQKSKKAKKQKKVWKIRCVMFFCSILRVVFIIHHPGIILLKPPATKTQPSLIFMESKIDEKIDQSTADLHEVSAKDCRNSSVIVYQDRAEVVRIISLSSLETTGEHTIKLHSLTNETDPESIRVKGLPGCEILEVSHELVRKSSTAQPDASDGSIAILKNKVSQLKKDQKNLDRNIGQVIKERKLIQSYADDAMSKGKEQASLSLSDARELIAFHTAEMIRLDDKESDLRDQCTLVDEALDSLKRDLSKLTTADDSSSSTRTELFSSSYSVCIVVALDHHTATEEEGLPLELQFSYVVRNATWTPSYDLRINSVANELSLSYFAEVRTMLELMCV
jgi:uncharacterized protein (TIGR02231 family)